MLHGEGVHRLDGDFAETYAAAEVAGNFVQQLLGEAGLHLGSLERQPPRSEQGDDESQNAGSYVVISSGQVV